VAAVAATAAPAAFGAGAAAQANGCSGAETRASAASVQTMRSAVLCLVNRERTARRLPALAAAGQLTRAAQRWTDTIVRSGRFTHGSGAAFAKRISATGYAWQAAGENIATGYPTPRAVLAGWMASTDHCRNILDPSFRDIGIGEDDSPVRPFASGPATWTQDFGLRMGQSAPSHNRRPMNGCPY
jgi:uncharacterized protein YkwD